MTSLLARTRISGSWILARCETLSALMTIMKPRNGMDQPSADVRLESVVMIGNGWGRCPQVASSD